MKITKYAVLLLVLSAAAFAELPVTSDLIIHLDAGSITGVSDGGTVSSWQDLATADSVNGTAAYVSGYGQPTWHALGAGSLPAVRFTNDILSSSQFNLPDAAAGLTVMALFTGDSSGTSSTRMAHIGSSSGVSGQCLGLDASTKIASADGSGYRFNNGYALTGTANPLTANYHIAAWKMAQGAQYQNAGFYVDSTTPRVLSCNSPSNTINYQTSGNILALGNGLQNGSYIAGDYYTGYVAEFLVYNRQLSTAEIGSLISYFENKYFFSLIRVNPTQMTVVEGQTSSASVVLDSQPSGDVVISVSNSNPSQSSVNPLTLVFTSANWNQPQQLQASGLIDQVWESGTAKCTVLLSADSTDPVFDNSVASLIVNVADCSRAVYIEGDMNEDCKVDIADLAVLSSHWLWCDPMKDDLCVNLN